MAGLIVAVAFGAAVLIAFAVFGGPLVFAAVPVVLFAVGWAAVQLIQRKQRATQAQSFRAEASAEKTDFTARDRQTTVPDDQGG